MIDEEWKIINGHIGYEVSSLGRVRSIDRIITKKGRWGNLVTNRLLGRALIFTQSTNNAGYYGCQLGRCGKKMVHRLVADAFCKKERGKNVVNHLNSIKTDNRAINLEWTTYRENSLHSRIKNRSRGKSFTIDTVLIIIKEAFDGSMVKELSKKYGVSRQCISGILSGSMWPSKDYPEIKQQRMNFPYISPLFGTRFRVD